VDVDLSRLVWRKSSASGPYSDNCVEVAEVDDRVLVRDSKNPDGPVLQFTRDQWATFVGATKAGEYDLE